MTTGTETQFLIKTAVRSVVRQLHDNNYHGLLASGRTTEVTTRLLHAGWTSLYRTNYTGPLYLFDKAGNALLYKDMDAYDRFNIIEETRMRQVLKYIREKNPKLLDAQSKRLCYVAEYSSKGEKYRKVSDMFKRLEFLDMSFAFFLTEEHPYPDAIVGLQDASIKEYLQILYEDIVSRDKPRVLRAKTGLQKLEDYIKQS